MCVQDSVAVAREFMKANKSINFNLMAFAKASE